MIGLAFLGVAMLTAGVALWVALDAARFQHRNHCGVLLFPTYRQAFAFQVGQRVGAPTAKLLLIVGAATLFCSVMAGPL